MPRLFVAGVVLVLAACAGGPSSTATSPKRCDPKDIPSSWSAAGPVFRSCEVDRPAKAIGTPSRLDWSPPRPSQACNTALVEFVVDTAGMPVGSTAQIVRATDSQLGSALLSTVPSRRYTPAVKNGQPVRQVIQEGATVVMRVVSAASPTALPPSRPSTAGCKP